MFIPGYRYYLVSYTRVSLCRRVLVGQRSDDFADMGTSSTIYEGAGLCPGTVSCRHCGNDDRHGTDTQIYIR